MNRQDFQTLSELRVQDSLVLLNNGRYAAAYYLCGYAVECALKACIAKQTMQFEFPDLVRVRESYTHDFKKLVKWAAVHGDAAWIRERVAGSVSRLVDDFGDHAFRCDLEGASGKDARHVHVA